MRERGGERGGGRVHPACTRKLPLVRNCHRKMAAENGAHGERQAPPPAARCFQSGSGEFVKFRGKISGTAFVRRTKGEMARNVGLGFLLLLAWCSGDASTSPATPRPCATREGPAALPAAGGSRHPANCKALSTTRAGGSPSPLALRVSGGGDFFDNELAVKKLYASLEITDEGRRHLAALEQGTTEWLDARRNRLTGSNFGAAAGHNKWKSPEGLAHDMLYATFKGNDATRWGTAHEPVACDEYIIARKAQLKEDHGDDYVFEVASFFFFITLEPRVE